MGLPMRISRNVLLTGLMIGVGLGVLVAGSMTFVDWQANPGGVFQGPEGTRWGPVLETFWSWWWPIALAVAPVAALVQGFLEGRAG